MKIHAIRGDKEINFVFICAIRGKAMRFVVKKEYSVVNKIREDTRDTWRKKLYTIRRFLKKTIKTIVFQNI